MNFLKKYSFIYKIILAVTLVVLVVIYMEHGYKIANRISLNFPNYTKDNSTDIVAPKDYIFSHTPYKADFIELATGTHMVPRLVTTSGNCLYYVTIEGSSPDNSESYTIWCENFENGHLTEQIMQLSTDNLITNITVDNNHNIYLFTKSRVDILEGELSRYYITKYKKNGDVLLYKEITESVIFGEQSEQNWNKYERIPYDTFFYKSEYYYYSPYDITSARVSKNGVIYAANEKGVVLFSNKGKNLTSIDGSNNIINGIINDRYGDTHVVYGDCIYDYEITNMTASSVHRINMFSKLSKTGYNFSSELDYFFTYSGESICSSGMNYDMLTKNSFGLFGTNLKKETTNEILIWANTGVDGSDIDYIAELADGRFLAVSHCFDDMSVEAAIISPINTNTENAPKVITLGVCWMDEYTQDAVIEYNKSQDDYLIQMVLANNVANASQCDIFSIDGNSEMAEQYVTEGKIEDLTPFFEASTKVSTEDFIPAVVESHTYDGLLIGIPSTVHLHLVDKNSAGGTADWTLEDMPNIVALNNIEAKGKLDAYTIAYTLAYYNCHEFVDLEQIYYHLDDRRYEYKYAGNYLLNYEENITSLNKIIKYAELFSLNESDYPLLEGFMKHDTYYNYLAHISELANINDLNHYTGILRDNGVTYCISSLSESKYESWQFIEYLLSAPSDSEFRFGTEIKDIDSYNGYGTPTRKDIIEYKLLQYDNSYDYHQVEQFLNEVSYMKYNISVLIMKRIAPALEAIFENDYWYEIDSIRYWLHDELQDYVKYYY